MKSLLVVALGLGLLMGCNTEKKAPEAFTVAPLPTPTVNTVGGIRDPSIKPLPAPLPVKGGIPDDSIKPKTLVGNGGVPDDSVKPTA
jgi:hypothetical protein